VGFTNNDLQKTYIIFETAKLLFMVAALQVKSGKELTKIFMGLPH